MAAKDAGCFSCVMLMHVHGAVNLEPATRASTPAAASESALEQRLGDPYKVTALPLSDIGVMRGAGEAGGARPQVVCVVSPPNLGYSVMGSENSQFPNHTQEFIRMVNPNSGSRTCLNGSEIAQFFDLYDKKLYPFFDSRFNKQLQDLQARFLARTPVADLDFTKKFVTFAGEEMPKHDFNSSMQLKHQSAELFWKTHYTSCIREKLYCPGTHANQCSLYFPGVDAKLLENLQIEAATNRRRSKKQKVLQQDDDPFEGLSIEFSSNSKFVLTIIFDNDPVSGLVKNKLWRGISLDGFFQQITQYLHLQFDGVEGFDLNALMSRTCVIDTACSDFSVPVKNVSIISFDRAAGAGGVAGAAGEGLVSALVDIHDDPGYQVGFWKYWIDRPPSTATSTHSQHRVLIPRELEEYVPGCLACNNTIKSVEPNFDASGKVVVSVVYTYHDGCQETIAYQPQSSDGAGVSESMETVRDSAPPVIYDDDDGPTSQDLSSPGASGRAAHEGGGRNPLHTTRHVRSLRNKSKTKRGKKIRRITNSRTRGRGRGLRRTRRR
jgi:hypothetical protein